MKLYFDRVYRLKLLYCSTANRTVVTIEMNLAILTIAGSVPNVIIRYGYYVILNAAVFIAPPRSIFAEIRAVKFHRLAWLTSSLNS